VADIRDAVVHVQTIAAALTGMKEAPADARAGMFAYPFAISYPGNGTFDVQPAGSSTGIHHIFTDMHMASESNLQEALRYLYAFVDDFANDVLADERLGGHVATIVTGKDGPPLRYTLVSGTYAGVKTIALHWELTVKIQNTIT
jgi:hypothetical protein